MICLVELEISKKRTLRFEMRNVLLKLCSIFYLSQKATHSICPKVFRRVSIAIEMIMIARFLFLKHIAVKIMLTTFAIGINNEWYVLS